MIYRKRIELITWDDVLAFCEQRLPEGATLDYKQDFPNDLAKTLAAMANTLGGLVLIGVSEEQDSRPHLPPPGIPFARGLSERVTNSILDNITPPFFPEVQVAVDPAGARCFVVVRVPESDETPHAIANNTRVYLRTGNRNNPEDLASVERIGWLHNRRAESVSLRQRLLAQADRRFDRAGYFDLPMITLVLAPLYPRDPLITPPALTQLVRNVEVRDYYGTSDFFPPRSGVPRILQDAVEVLAKSGPRHPPAQFRMELNTFGILWYRQTASKQLEEEDGGGRVIRESEILTRLDEFFDSAAKFFDALGYRGMLHFSFDLRGGLTREKFAMYAGRGAYDLAETVDEEITLDLTLRGQDIDGAKKTAVMAVAQRLSWACGNDTSPHRVNNIFRELKGAAVVEE